MGKQLWQFFAFLVINFRPAFWRIPQVVAQRKPIARQWCWGGSTVICSFSIDQVTVALDLQGDINVLLLGDPGTAKSQVHKKPLATVDILDVIFDIAIYIHLWEIDWCCLVMSLSSRCSVSSGDWKKSFDLEFFHSFGQFLKFTHQVAPISVCASWSYPSSADSFFKIESWEPSLGTPVEREAVQQVSLLDP